MSVNEMVTKIEELRDLVALIQEAEAQADAIRDQIKAQMGEREELWADHYRITWKRVKSSRLDAKSLRAELPEVAARYTREQETRRFVVM